MDDGTTISVAREGTFASEVALQVMELPVTKVCVHWLVGSNLHDCNQKALGVFTRVEKPEMIGTELRDVDQLVVHGVIRHDDPPQPIWKVLLAVDVCLGAARRSGIGDGGLQY